MGNGCYIVDGCCWFCFDLCGVFPLHILSHLDDQTWVEFNISKLGKNNLEIKIVMGKVMDLKGFASFGRGKFTIIMLSFVCDMYNNRQVFIWNSEFRK